MARIYQSTPPEFQAILVGGLCPGAEDVAQCEANLPEFWGMIAALLWPGYWDPSVGLVAHPHTVFTFKCGKENRNLGLVPQFGRMCILCCKKTPFGDQVYGLMHVGYFSFFFGTRSHILAQKFICVFKTRYFPANVPFVALCHTNRRPMVLFVFEFQLLSLCLMPQGVNWDPLCAF